VAEAARDLRHREGAKVEDIHVLRMDEPHGPFLSGSVQSIIEAWAKQQSVTAVVWTGLPSNFEEQNGKFSPATALAHLKQLPSQRKGKAIEYIRQTLPFVKTAFRAAFEADSDFTK
jgi:hypothetical protein